LDALAERIEGILRRKGQVVLYGPPGTGKTYRALAVAKDLAARRSFGRISPLLQKRSARGSRAGRVVDLEAAGDVDQPINIGKDALAALAQCESGMSSHVLQ
jgi:DNA polymerase III delta prime subunit